MKTDEMKCAREAELEATDEKKKLAKARDELNQFHQVRKILFNIMFRDKLGNRILSNDIIWDVLAEIRSERKILKVLHNDNVESYVNLDMTEVDMLDYKDDKDLSFEVKLACDEKVTFRKRMAVEKVGILRLDYILRVMRKVYFEKATIANPDSFKAKVRSLEKADRRVA